MVKNPEIQSTQPLNLAETVLPIPPTEKSKPGFLKKLFEKATGKLGFKESVEKSGERKNEQENDQQREATAEAVLDTTAQTADTDTKTTTGTLQEDQKIIGTIKGLEEKKKRLTELGKQAETKNKEIAAELKRLAKELKAFTAEKARLEAQAKRDTAKKPKGFVPGEYLKLAEEIAGGNFDLTSLKKSARESRKKLNSEAPKTDETETIETQPTNPERDPNKVVWEDWTERTGLPNNAIKAEPTKASVEAGTPNVEPTAPVASDVAEQPSVQTEPSVIVSKEYQNAINSETETTSESEPSEVDTRFGIEDTDFGGMNLKNNTDTGIETPVSTADTTNKPSETEQMQAADNIIKFPERQETKIEHNKLKLNPTKEQLTQLHTDIKKDYENVPNISDEEKNKFAWFKVFQELNKNDDLKQAVDSKRKDWAADDAKHHDLKLDGDDYEQNSYQWKLQTGEALKQIIENGVKDNRYEYPTKAAKIKEYTSDSQKINVGDKIIFSSGKDKKQLETPLEIVKIIKEKKFGSDETNYRLMFKENDQKINYKTIRALEDDENLSINPAEEEQMAA